MSDQLICTCLTASDDQAAQHMDHCEWKRRERDLDQTATVLVFRNNQGQPVAVPESIVNEAERPYRAYKALMTGKSWAEIAREEKYADAAAAHYDVERYIQEGKQLVTSRTRRDQLQLEVARLDNLQALAWPQVEQGHLPAMKFALDVISVRIKALGLAEMAADEGGDDGPTTVIIPGGDEYEAELRKAAGETSS